MPVVQTQKLADQVTRGVAGRIISDADAALPSEQEIGAEYGVSKTVAREVVGRLSDMNLVTVSHGRRMQRRPESDWDYLNPMVLELQDDEGTRRLLIELHEVRRLIEPAVAASAATSRTPEQLARIQAALVGMRASGSDHRSYLGYDLDFHRGIVDAARNRVLSHIVDSVGAIMRTSMQTSGRYAKAIPGRLEQDAVEHQAIVDAVAAQDPEAARAAMIEHLRDNLKAFLPSAPSAPSAEDRDASPPPSSR